MASGEVQGYLLGAYDSSLKISTGDIITLEEYVKRVNDDGESLTITGLITGAYDAMVELSDGTVVALSEHVRSPGALSIAKIVGGAYESVVDLETNGVVTTANKVILDKVVPESLELDNIEEEEGDGNNPLKAIGEGEGSEKLNKNSPKRPWPFGAFPLKNEEVKKVDDKQGPEIVNTEE